MAWVGFAEFGEEKKVRPVAHADSKRGGLKLSTSPGKTNRAGRGPAGTAIRTGKYQVAHNIPNDPSFDPWRKQAVQHGYKSSITLPLSGDGRTFGVLAMYALEVDAFGPREIEVLKELADDLAGMG